MNYSLSTQNIEVTEADEQLLEEKVGRLTKHLTPPFHPEIMIRHDKHHRNGQVISCRINVNQNGKVFHVERTGSTVQEALDETLNALKNELIEERDKRRHRR